MLVFEIKGPLLNLDGDWEKPIKIRADSSTGAAAHQPRLLQRGGTRPPALLPARQTEGQINGPAAIPSMLLVPTPGTEAGGPQGEMLTAPGPVASTALRCSGPLPGAADTQQPVRGGGGKECGWVPQFQWQQSFKESSSHRDGHRPGSVRACTHTPPCTAAHHGSASTPQPPAAADLPVPRAHRSPTPLGGKGWSNPSQGEARMLPAADLHGGAG